MPSDTRPLNGLASSCGSNMGGWRAEAPTQSVGLFRRAGERVLRLVGAFFLSSVDGSHLHRSSLIASRVQRVGQWLHASSLGTSISPRTPATGTSLAARCLHAPVRTVFGATKYHGWRMSGTSYLCVRSTTPFVERFLSRETRYWSTAATLCRGRDVRRGILHPWFGM